MAQTMSTSNTLLEAYIAAHSAAVQAYGDQQEIHELGCGSGGSYADADAHKRGPVDVAGANRRRDAAFRQLHDQLSALGSSASGALAALVAFATNKETRRYDPLLKSLKDKVAALPR